MSQRGLFYGWVVLAAAATVVAFGQGSLFSLGVLLKPLEDSMHWSRSAISTTALINWIGMGAGSFFWGAVSDRLGSRLVTIAGGFLLGLGLVLSSQGDRALAPPRHVWRDGRLRRRRIPDAPLRDGDQVVHRQPRA